MTEEVTQNEIEKEGLELLDTVIDGIMSLLGFAKDEWDVDQEFFEAIIGHTRSKELSVVFDFYDKAYTFVESVSTSVPAKYAWLRGINGKLNQTTNN